MKKLAALFCLILALLASPVGSASADILQPTAPSMMAFWFINGQPVITQEYAVTEIDFDDGNVYTLDTSDGSNFTLDMSLDGTTNFVTKWMNGNIVWQWISSDD